MSPLPVGIPGPEVGTETALSDATWINWVREAMEDWPTDEQDVMAQVDGSTGNTVTAGSVPFIVSSPPIYDNGELYIATVPGGGGAPTVYTVVPWANRFDLAADQVAVNYDNGQLVLNPVPAQGSTLIAGYSRVKNTDQKILTQLHAGLRAMNGLGLQRTFVDQSITLQQLVYDYPLPNWALSPKVGRIQKVEVVRILIPGEDYFQITNWNRIGQDQIHIPDSQRWAPTGKLRITGTGPYTALGDLEPDLVHLPVIYAVGMLHLKKESRRLRTDTAAMTRDQGAVLPGTNANYGKDLLAEFRKECEERAKVGATGASIKIRAPRYARMSPAYR